MTKQWNKAGYRQRKAARQDKIEPEWITNPETGESFFVRRVSPMAYAIAGVMANDLVNDAVEAWKEQGVEATGEDKAKTQAEQEAANRAGQRNVALMARVLQDALVIPKLVVGGTGENELDPSEVDGSDLLYFFKWATGQAGMIGMRGGEAMNVDDLARFRKKPGRRTRVGTDSAELQSATG